MKTVKDDRCPFVVCLHRYDNRSWDEHCNKIPAEGCIYCPKHALVLAEAAAELDRKMERVRRGKEKKKLYRDALAASPLAAVNPKFEKGTGYEK